MVRRYRPTETPVTPAVTDPALLREDEADTLPSVLCECGSSIDARHVERHRRSKKHRVELDWYRTQLLTAIAEQQIRLRNQQPITA
jgi:hypothetical protein